MKVISFVLLSFLLINSVSLSYGQKASEAQCANQVNIEVNGLVCDFCARAIAKVFSKKTEVSTVNVDLDNGKIVINMKPEQSIDDDKLTALIADSGYDVVNINRGCDE